MIVLVASGCAGTGLQQWLHQHCKVGPDYCPPPAPVATDWMYADDPHVQRRQIEDWWTVFQDPALNSLIERAYQQNLNLRVLGARVLQARAQRAIAVGNLFPQSQQAFGQYSREGLSFNAVNNPGAIAGTLPAGTPIPPLLGNFYPDWQTGFNLSWELDFWGRYRRLIESASANVDASEEDYNAGLVTLLA